MSLKHSPHTFLKTKAVPDESTSSYVTQTRDTAGLVCEFMVNFIVSSLMVLLNIWRKTSAFDESTCGSKMKGLVWCIFGNPSN